MSRTYRRTSGQGWWSKEDALRDLVLVGYLHWEWVKLNPGTKEYRKASAAYHRDKTSSFKEPGPSWFRTMFNERPMRRYNKRELLKFMRQVEYEPMVYDKYPLDYWT